MASDNSGRRRLTLAFLMNSQTNAATNVACPSTRINIRAGYISFASASIPHVHRGPASLDHGQQGIIWEFQNWMDCAHSILQTPPTMDENWAAAARDDEAIQISLRPADFAKGFFRMQANWATAILFS